MNYTFDPEDFGYEHISNFPELREFFGNTTFIKVTAIGGKDFGRAVYWYSYCYNIGMTGDDRWKIGTSSHDESRREEFSSRTTYSGLITSEDFAKGLLMHIFGTTKNDSVLTDGKMRLEQNINKHRLVGHK